MAQTFKVYPEKQFEEVKGIANVRNLIKEGNSVISCDRVKISPFRTVLRKVSQPHTVDSANAEFKARAKYEGTIAFYVDITE